MYGRILSKFCWNTKFHPVPVPPLASIKIMKLPIRPEDIGREKKPLRTKSREETERLDAAAMRSLLEGRRRMLQDALKDPLDSSEVGKNTEGAVGEKSTQ